MREREVERKGERDSCRDNSSAFIANIKLESTSLLLTRSRDREKRRDKEKQRRQATFSEVEARISVVNCRRKRSQLPVLWISQTRGGNTGSCMAESSTLK